MSFECPGIGEQLGDHRGIVKRGCQMACFVGFCAEFDDFFDDRCFRHHSASPIESGGDTNQQSGCSITYRLAAIAPLFGSCSLPEGEASFSGHDPRTLCILTDAENSTLPSWE